MPATRTKTLAAIRQADRLYGPNWSRWYNPATGRDEYSCGGVLIISIRRGYNPASIDPMVELHANKGA